MKRVLYVVACGGYLVGRSSASASGWGGAGRSTGAGGAWAKFPPTDHNREENGRHPVDDPNVSATGHGWGAAPPDGSSGVQDRGQQRAESVYLGQGSDDDNVGLHEQLEYYHHRQHQQRQHDPPHTPQSSHWMGHPDDAPPQQQQLQHQPQQHRHFYDYEQCPQQPVSPSGGPEPLRLGTKWKSIVSRVRDSVRPGQYWDASRAKRDWEFGVYGGPCGISGDEIGSTFSPPGSSWVGSAPQKPGHTSPPGYFENQVQPDAYRDYGNERHVNDGVAHDSGPRVNGDYGNQDQHVTPHPAESFDPRWYRGYGNKQHGNEVVAHDSGPGVNGDYGNQERHVTPYPAESFDPRASRGVPAHEARFGHDYTGASEASPSSTGVIQQTPNIFSGNNVGNESKISGGGGIDGGSGGGVCSDGLYVYTTQDVGVDCSIPPPISAQDEYGAVGVGFSQPGLQRFESGYAPREKVVGQGWAASSTTSVSPQQEQRLGGEWSGQEGEMDTAPVSVMPAAADVATAESTSTTMQEPIGEQNSTPSLPPSSLPWTPPSDLSTTGDGYSEGLVAEACSPLAERTMDLRKRNEFNQASAPAYSREAVTPPAPPPAQAMTARGATQSFRPAGGLLDDTMPRSADHDMEEVDWGEDASGETRDGEEDIVSRDTVGPSGGIEGRLGKGRGEEEEEALIRELERMDSIGGREMQGGGNAREGSLPTTAPSDERNEREEDVAIDTAVEHHLDVLFDSILEDGDAGVFDDAERSPAAPGSRNDEPTLATALPTPPQGALPGRFPSKTERGAESEAASVWRGWDNEKYSATDRWKLEEEAFGPRDGGPSAPVDESPGSFEIRAGEQKARFRVEGSTDAKQFTAELMMAHEELRSASSMWGQRGRWASLPRHAVVFSESEPDSEREEEDEEGAAGIVVVDPIELPPSATTDEIWNDQHLQDQLDAYWEQSRRGRNWAGVGVETEPVPPGRHQLATYGGTPQRAYGPGDWVGKSTEMAQEPLPAALDGGARILREHFVGAPNGVVRAGWVSPPLLYEGNRAPINIYGNVHVHLESGQDVKENKSRPSPELSARERYFSQGETSWSVSGR